MAFNDANIDNRLRKLVRGRVIVATTSTSVEFLDYALNFSYPLYSFGPLGSGMVAVFMVEVDGYLTFDKDAYVKISGELKPFTELYFRPTEFNVVRPADPLPQTVQSFTVGADKYDGENYYTDQVTINISTSSGVIQVLFSGPQMGRGDFETLVRNTFQPGTGVPYRGPAGYPPFVKI